MTTLLYMTAHRFSAQLLRCVVVLCAIAPLYAQTSGARFLLIQPSPTANAMGGAGVALIRSSYESFNNPAALAYGPSLHVSNMGQQPRPENSDNVHAQLSVGFGIDSVTGGSVSCSRFDFGDFKRIDYQGRVLEIYSPSAVQLTIAAGTELLPESLPNVSVGLSLNYLHYSLAPGYQQSQTLVTAMTFSCGVGVLMRRVAPTATLFTEDAVPSPTKASKNPSRYDPGFSFAFSANNLGPPDYLATQTDPLPMCFRLGTTYTLANKRNVGGLVCVDLESRPLDGSAVDYLHTGMELELFKTLVLRGGYSAALGPEYQSHFSYGFGAHYAFFHLYYAHYTPSILGIWQTGMSLIWDFK